MDDALRSAESKATKWTNDSGEALAFAFVTRIVTISEFIKSEQSEDNSDRKNICPRSGFFR
ncbi:hypothetical protein PCCS19_14210 [Paenibacillus sp. CCS19]|nr:hypothetical protein PCCS19_14210 [Paenibacillus cellulosilyticus]